MSIQKKPVSFRFSEDTLKRIKEISKRLFLNNTQVVEYVIKYYYDRIFSSDYFDL